MTHSTPGVYIQEVSTLPSSVVPVSTAIPAFIGYTQTGGGDGRPLDGKATRISSLLEYQKLFGYAPNQSLVITAEDGMPVSVRLGESPSPYLLYYQLQMYFLNGGGPCYIVSVGSYSDAVSLGDMDNSIDVSTNHQGGLRIAEKVDEVTLLVFPDAPALSDTDYYSLYKGALAQCDKLKDRFTLIDVKTSSGSPVAVFRNGIGQNFLKYGAAYYPDLHTTLTYQYDPGYIENFSYKNASDGSDATESDRNSWLADTRFTSTLKRLINAFSIKLPPSGAITGIYAQVDRTRGVFKAPANISLNGVIAPAKRITHEEQQDLNVHPTGKSVNVIRSFSGKGVLVWGARTLEGNSNEWRYVPVRRFFIFAEESIKKATESFVFEPNNNDSWLRIKGMIENFLINQWRAGALVGSTINQAFYVRVGLGETMTNEDILNGNLVIEIGMAVVRPAEFIIIRFSHKLQEV